MNKKIVFFDIDGTLVDHNKKLPISTKQAIQELQRNGVYVALATGRPPFLYEDIRKELGINSYISFNGQHVVFEGETIYKNPLVKHELQKVHHDTLEYGYPMVFVSDSEMRATTPDHPYIKGSLLTSDYPKIDPEFYLDEVVYQALIYCNEKEEDVFKDNHTGFHFLRWHKYSCDVIPGGGSKAIGVNKIIEASGLDPDHSYAFGDGMNDMEMIQEIGTGVAMGNAIPELKSVADFTTKHVEDEGIIRALEKYHLL